MSTSREVNVGVRPPNINLLLRPLADQIVAVLSATGQPSTVQNAQQLIAAAFGFFSYKTMLEAAPVVYQEEPPIDWKRPPFTQLRRNFIEERIGRLFTADEWRSRVLANVVYEAVFTSRLRIGALEAWGRGALGGSVLAALGNSPDFSGAPPVSPPVNATAAIKKRLVPALDHEQPLRAPLPNRHGRLGYWAVILRKIEEGGYRLWRWPGRDREVAELPESAREFVYSDRYFPDPLDLLEGSPGYGSAELGLGLCLIKHELFSGDAGNYEGASFLVPMKFYRRAQDRSVGEWTLQWQTSGWTNFPPGRFTMPLSRIHRLPSEFEQLPEIFFCETCRQLYADVVEGPFVHRCIM
jgi:hypothetical protein